MLKPKKILLWCMGAVGVLAALLLTAALLVPQFINSEVLKNRIQVIVTEKTGGSIDFQQLGISIFPAPGLDIMDGNIKIPNVVSGTFKSVTVCPEIFPLLVGRLNLSRLRLENPDISITLPSRQQEQKGVGEDSTSTDLKQKLDELLVPLGKFVPDLQVTIDQGQFVLHEKKKKLATLKDLSLNLGFETDDSRNVEVELQGVLPSLSIHLKGKEKVFKINDLGIKLQQKNEKFLIILKDLNLDQPGLDLSGEFLWDEANSATSIDLQGRVSDVQAVREITLALAGKVPVVQNIFDILRGGNVPQIRFHSAGKSPAELGALENIRIDGQVQRGTTYLPWIDLQLHNASGNVTIAKGVLEVKNLSSQYEKSRGYDGALKVGLADDNDIFRLELMLDIELARLKPVLKKVIDNEAFSEELKRILNLKGKGKGKLVLGDSLRSIAAQVDVTELNLSADYERIPLPVEISQGHYYFTANQVKIKGLAGKLGKSPFSNVSTTYRWRDEFQVQVDSGQATLEMDELYPWLSSFEQLRSVLKDIKAVRGTVNISSIDLTGAVNKSGKWKFNVAGDMKNLQVESSLLPETLKIRSGALKANPRRISIQKAKISAMDADLEITGNVNDFRKNPASIDGTISGKVGSSANRWIQQKMNLPPDYEVHAPLKISQGRFTWKPDSELSAAGKVTIQDGPEISGEIQYGPSIFLIKNMVLKDKDSSATLTFKKLANELDFNFSGNVSSQTADRILVSNKFSSGWIEGDIHARIPKDQQTLETSRGHIKGAMIPLPPIGEQALSLDLFSIETTENRIRINSSELTWGENQVKVTGDIDVSPRNYALNLDVSTSGVEWSTLEKLLSEKPDGPAKGTDNPPDELPLSGTARLEMASFTWEGFTWEPVKANVSLDKNTVKMDITRADMCGVSFPGEVSITPQGLSLEFHADAKNQELEQSYRCLTDGDIQMSGSFNLTLDAKAQGKAEDLVDSISGVLDFEAKKGRIKKHLPFAKVLEVINITEIYRGKIPNLRDKGMNYNSTRVKGELHGGNLLIKEYLLDGETLGIIGQGKVNLIDRKIKAELLVAPLKTVDSVIKKLPGINYILAGSLISIPVGIKGDILDPEVTILSPAAVGSGLLGIAERIIKAPVKIIETLTPNSKRK